MQSEIDSLREINSKLLAKVTELRKENAEVKAENVKLKHALKEHEARFTNLEQKDKEKTTLIAKLDDDIREIKQEQNAVNISAQSNTSIPKSPINSIPLPLALSADQINISPVADQYDTTESAKRFNSKSLEDDRETDAFLDEVHKKKVSNEIRQRNREKKLSQSHVLSQDSSSTTSESLHSEEKQVNLSEIKVAKIPYNQKVEQDLICELLEFIRCHNSTSLLNSISSKHVSFDAIPLGSADLTPGSVPHLAHLFDKAEKTGRKEKLRWYYYSEEYEKKVVTLRSENNISDQMARTQIYDEMELYLPGKKREYLRKMTQKAKNIYTLFKGIGIDKIGVVTSSADAISRLTDAQIQNIINLYTDELTKSQKLIGVNNCSRARDLPAESESKKSPDVGISTPPTSKTNQTNERAQSKPTYDRTYFRNKILDQYPNLYREGSSENFDYYGMTDETSCEDYICSLCKLDHDDEEIEGKYKARSYFIKYEQHEIEIVA